MKAESCQAQLNCISIMVWACEKSNTKKPNAQEDKKKSYGRHRDGDDREKRAKLPNEKIRARESERERRESMPAFTTTAIHRQKYAEQPKPVRQ